MKVHRPSAYSQDLLFTAHLHDSRLYQAKGAKTGCAHHPCILCCLLSQYSHNPPWSTLGLHFAQNQYIFKNELDFARNLKFDFLTTFILVNNLFELQK